MVPSRLPKSTRCPHHPPMGQQGDHREQSQQSRGGSSDRQLRPLCLCVSNPRCLRASWKFTSSCQRITNQRTIRSGSASRSVQRRAWALNSPSRSRTRAPDHGRQARGLPNGRLRSYFYRALLAPVAVRYLGSLPNGERVFDHRRKVWQPIALYTRSPYLAWAPRRGLSRKGRHPA